MKKEILCRDCGLEFDPTIPYHNENGYYNQCGDCAEDEDIIKVKAHMGVTQDGSFLGIDIVSGEEYKRYQEVVEIYGDES